MVQGGSDSRSEEFRSAEPAGEDQPEPSRNGVTSVTPGAPPGMTHEEVERRSDFGRYIPMSSLPGDKETLTAGARDLNAPDWVFGELGRLPDGETYETVNQIWVALGYHVEEQRT